MTDKREYSSIFFANVANTDNVKLDESLSEFHLYYEFLKVENRYQSIL